MSYILEALKRSDNERTMGHIPSLGAVHARDARSASSPWLSVLLGMLLALILVAIVLLWLYRSQIPVYAERLPVVGQALAGLLATDSSAPAQPREAAGSQTREQPSVAAVTPAPVPTTPPSRVDVVNQESAVESPAPGTNLNTATNTATPVVMQDQTAPQAQAVVEPAPVVQPTVVALQEVAQPTAQATAKSTAKSTELATPGPTKRVLEPVADSQGSATQSGGAVTQPVAQVAAASQVPVQATPQPLTQPAAQPVQQPAQEKPAEETPASRYDDLTADIRRQLPPLNLNVVSYSSKPEQRFVMVNQEVFDEGEHIAGGVWRVEITADGPVIDFRGRLYLLRP